MDHEKERPADWDRGQVRALRDHLGYTQGEMARQMGVRQQTISEWETGMYRPRGSSSTLLHIIAERAGFSYSTGPDPARDAGPVPSDPEEPGGP